MGTVSLISCACGCGATLEPTDKRGRPRTFLPSHWSRIQPNGFQIVPCDNCRKPLTLSRYLIGRCKHHFCDNKCEARYVRDNATKRGERNGHYNTITVPCAGCQAPVSKARSLINRRNNRVYCAACIPEHLRRGRKGFYEGYPKEFSASLRGRIRKRDAFTCQICGRSQDETGTLHVHHIDYDKNNNDARNLIALCVGCHGRTNWACAHWKETLQAKMRERFPHDTD